MALEARNYQSSPLVFVESVRKHKPDSRGFGYPLHRMDPRGVTEGNK